MQATHKTSCYQVVQFDGQNIEECQKLAPELVYCEGSIFLDNEKGLIGDYVIKSYAGRMFILHQEDFKKYWAVIKDE